MPYDLCVRIPFNESARAAELLKGLGWNGFCLLAGKNEAKHAITAEKTGAYMSVGLLINPRNKSELVRSVSLARREWEIIAVECTSPETARAAAETRGVDIITGWEARGTDNIINYVTAKMAAENDVAIAFSFHPILSAYDRSRASVMSRLIEVAGFVRKYRAPFILASGAISYWDMRSPSELSSFGRMLGFSARETRKSISGQIMAENRKRLSGRWIMPGVERD